MRKHVGRCAAENVGRVFACVVFVLCATVEPGHANNELPDVLINEIELCNDTSVPVAARIETLTEIGWASVPYSERLLDVWAQGDLAKTAKTTTDERAFLEGYAKWRGMAESWIAERTTGVPDVSRLAGILALRRDLPGSIGLLVQHPAWQGVLEIQLRWTVKSGPIDALSCLFISEQPFPETVLDIGAQLDPPEKLFETETQVYTASEALVALPNGAKVHLERRHFRLSNDHWAGVSSDVRVQSVLLISIRPSR